MAFRKKKTFHLSADEIVLMSLLISRLDEGTYKHPETKALILKCRAEMLDPSDYCKIHPD